MGLDQMEKEEEFKMTYRSEKQDIPGGFVELGTAIYKDKEFTARGAFVKEEKALLYVKEPEKEVVTWGGERVGTFTSVGSWRGKVPGKDYPIQINAIRVQLNDGRRYHGRYSSESSHVVLKRIKGDQKEEIKQMKLEL